jgi:hypothetical protein
MGSGRFPQKIKELVPTKMMLPLRCIESKFPPGERMNFLFVFGFDKLFIFIVLVNFVYYPIPPPAAPGDPKAWSWKSIHRPAICVNGWLGRDGAAH